MSENKTVRSVVRSHRSSLPSRIAEQDDSPLLARAFTGALWALAVTSFMGIILISLFSFIVLSNPDPASLIPFFSLGTLMPCMFAGGFICAKKVKESPLLCGILSGGLTVAVYLLVSLILRGIEASGNSALASIIIHVCAVLFSILGAYAGNIKKPGKKRRFG